MEKEKFKKIIIVVGPLILFGIGYLAYRDFAGGTNHSNKEVSVNDQEGLMIPTESSDKNVSKIKSYEDQKRKFEKKKVSDNEAEEYNFFLGGQEEEKKPEPKPEPKVEEKAEVRKERIQTKVVYVNREVEVEPEKEVEKKRKLSRSGFYGSSNEKEEKEQQTAMPRNGALKCEVYRDHEVQAGNSITLRVLESGFINGKKIPKNTFINAKARLGSQVLDMAVDGIKVGGDFINVNLSAYSEAGTKGLKAENNLKQDVAKDGANEALGEVTTTVSLPMIGSVSMDGARKKVNERSVPILDGTVIYLK